MHDSFYITLNSDASVKAYENNSPSFFRNKLDRRLCFQEAFEVALVEVFLPNTLCNIVGLNGTTWIYDGINNMFRSILTQGIFTDINSLISNISEQLEGKIKFEFDDDGRIICSATHNPGLVVRFHDVLAKQLGFLGDDKEYHGVPYKAKAWPNLNLGIQQKIYFNTNIIPHQLIGSHTKPCLRSSILELKDYCYGTYTCLNFTNPYYYPVSLTSFDEVLIDIRDEHDENLVFLNGVTSCVLHFRRRL